MQITIKQDNNEIEFTYNISRVSATIEDNNLFVGLVFVEKNQRRKGIGTALIHRCMQYAYDNNLHFELKVAKLDNVPIPSLINFYKKCGLEKYEVASTIYFEKY